MAEAADTTDVNASIDDFADLGASLADAESTAAEEPSTEGNKETTEGTEPPAPADEPKEDPKPSEGDEPTEDAEDPDKPADAPAEGEEPKRGAEARKAELNNEIRELVTTKNNLKEEITQLNAEKYRTQTEEELVADGMDPAEARVKAAEQRQQLAEYNSSVADLNHALELETLNVRADFPIFDPKSESFNEEVFKQAQTLYNEIGGIQRDENTNLVNGVRVMPYQFFQFAANLYESASSKAKAEGQVSGQKATERMLAAAEPSGAAAPVAEKKADAFWNAFDNA